MKEEVISGGEHQQYTLLCPVKPGQAVYVAAFGEIYEFEIAEVRITNCGWYAVDTNWCGRHGLVVATPNSWLDTVFPTREAAWDKLVQLGGDKR